MDIRAAALQFCAAHPVVASVIPGAKSAERVRQNVELMRQPIPASFWQALKQEGILPAHAPTRGDRTDGSPVEGEGWSRGAEEGR